MWDYQVVVVGSGAAGLMAAIHAARSADCALLTDGAVGRSNSIMAQGGLQLPRPGAESLRLFEQDIQRSARDEVDTERVHTFVANVAPTIEELAGWGLALDRDPGGDFVRRGAGGLSEPRIVSVRDQIGPAIIKVLRHHLEETRVAALDHAVVTDIEPISGGLVVHVERSGRRDRIRARAVVCCTGGTAYREAQRRAAPSTNPANRNHELLDRLVERGLPTIQADYFQYQPFGIVDTWRANPAKCVPESIVNFPVRILDRDRRDIGEIRRDRYELTQLLFALADDGRAVDVGDGRHGFWLTVSDVADADIERTFPKLHQHQQRTGRIGEDVLIFPFLHYYLGGLRSGPRGATAVPGLYVAGEMVGGLHGRNRLMGNGITDSLVHGAIAGEAVREYVART